MSKVTPVDLAKFALDIHQDLSVSPGEHPDDRDKPHAALAKERVEVGVREGVAASLGAISAPETPDALSKTTRARRTRPRRTRNNLLEHGALLGAALDHAT